jgi:hypothetical protein
VIVVVLVGADYCPRGDRLIDQGLIVACLTSAVIRLTISPIRWIVPKVGCFSVAIATCPRSRFRRRRRPDRPFA